ncbi:hypothetical protein D5085_02740 [Ectothiorhodospiraceae bacterium BW-2]|nr:hypothetical protein D5085_02740 [Ectothiorhodospiraceae bacterium BW-2]
MITKLIRDCYPINEAAELIGISVEDLIHIVSVRKLPVSVLLIKQLVTEPVTFGEMESTAHKTTGKYYLLRSDLTVFDLLYLSGEPVLRVCRHPSEEDTWPLSVVHKENSANNLTFDNAKFVLDKADVEQLIVEFATDKPTPQAKDTLHHKTEATYIKIIATLIDHAEGIDWRDRVSGKGHAVADWLIADYPLKDGSAIADKEFLAALLLKAKNIPPAK